MKIGLVVPHIFMQEALLSRVIFSPGRLAMDLANELVAMGEEVTLYVPGPVGSSVHQVTADLEFFERELGLRGDTYLELLKKHPLTFITLARQAQNELVARAYADANAGLLDVVHVYTNEEETALPFAQFCSKPVVFTHHDPFNFLVRYRSVMPRYKELNWISMSRSQRSGMPADTNWVGNVYHGLPLGRFHLEAKRKGDYILFMGRIIEPKGVHLAIAAVRQYNREHVGAALQLVIAGKHYGDGDKDKYWTQQIQPEIDGDTVRYIGFVGDDADKQELLAGARALVMPSVFDEPFGLVQIEALACGTPIVGMNNGAISEVVRDGINGALVQDPSELAAAFGRVCKVDRADCRADFEERFSASRMAAEHLAIYQSLATRE